MKKHQPGGTSANIYARRALSNLKMRRAGSKTKIFFKKYWIQIIFAVIALAWGGLLVRNVGSFVGVDMDMHYYSSYAIATGQAFNRNTSVKVSTDDVIHASNTVSTAGLISPTNSIILQSKWQLAPYGMCGHPSPSSDSNRVVFSHDPQYHKICEAVNVPNSTKMEKVNYRPQYPPLNWLPSAAGLKVGMILNKSPATSRQIARLFNLITYIALFVIAIGFIPSRRAKIALAAIGLFPLSVSLASQMAADALNIAWCALFVAYIIKLYTNRINIKKRQVALLAGLGLGLFWLKVAYAPLWLLIFALPRRCLNIRKKSILFASVAILGVGLYLVWSHFYGSTLYMSYSMNNGDLILHHLPQAVALIAVSAATLPFSDLVYNGLVLPSYLLILIAVAAMIFITRQRLVQPKSFTDFIRRYRLVILTVLALFLSLSMTFAALLLSWTNIYKDGFTAIPGFQPRYVLPLLPLFCVIFFLPTRQDSSVKIK